MILDERVEVKKLSFINGLVRYLQDTFGLKGDIEGQFWHESKCYDKYELRVYGDGETKETVNKIKEHLCGLLNDKDCTFKYGHILHDSYFIEFNYLDKDILLALHTFLKIKGYDIKKYLGAWGRRL